MKPFLKWAGGKRWLTLRLRDLNTISFRRYVEPFIGGGAIFFGTEPKRAILSDCNKALIETYVAIRSDWRSIYEILTWHQAHHSDRHYYDIRERYFDTLAERAAQFIYLNRTCWNGLYRENIYGMFNVPKGTKDKVIFPDDDFERASEILKPADLSCCDFEQTIRNTGPGDLVFVDPPYTVRHNKNGFLKYNERIFCWSDQVRLSRVIYEKSIQGVKFIITNAYHESVIELYEGFAELIPLSRTSILAADREYRGKTQEALFTVGLRISDVLCETNPRRQRQGPRNQATHLIGDI